MFLQGIVCMKEKIPHVRISYIASLDFNHKLKFYTDHRAGTPSPFVSRIERHCEKISYFPYAVAVIYLISYCIYRVKTSIYMSIYLRLKNFVSCCWFAAIFRGMIILYCCRRSNVRIYCGSLRFLSLALTHWGEFCKPLN